MAGGWNSMIFKVPSNPNHSAILSPYDQNQTYVTRSTRQDSDARL